MENKMTKQELEEAILADLKGEMLYIAIAAKYRVGTNRVQELAKKNGLTRKRGQKVGTKRVVTTAATPVQEAQ
jgi:hypothetical protein